MKLDSVDRKIIAQLQKDGRMTLKELGNAIGYSSMGAKKRIERLIKEGIIKVSAMLNFKKLNFYAAWILLEVDSPESMRQILRKFRECPRIVYVFTALGGYNLMALAVAGDMSTLECISMEKCSLRSQRGIRRSEFYPIGNIHYFPFLPIRASLVTRNKKKPPCGVECETCERYIANECEACPATVYYKGPF